MVRQTRVHISTNENGVESVPRKGYKSGAAETVQIPVNKVDPIKKSPLSNMPCIFRVVEDHGIVKAYDPLILRKYVLRKYVLRKYFDVSGDVRFPIISR